MSAPTRLPITLKGTTIKIRHLHIVFILVQSDLNFYSHDVGPQTQNNHNCNNCNN